MTASTQTPILKLAIMAVGGQGGGVLTGWIVALAEAGGWRAQSTAVAGVAQRTGATIYYVEMAPESGQDPIFALAPAPGDVDILIAAEWMEAGRAVQRGFVTPDRTTLIASTHRALSVAEKIVPGDGRADPEPVGDALAASAAKVIAFDMQTPADAAGSVVSATLFGALAGSGALPFPVTAFEDTIRAGGRGVDRSLAAFRAGLAGPVDDADSPAPAPVRAIGPADKRAAWDRLCNRLTALPSSARPLAEAGLRHVVDFQDTGYGADYLERVEALLAFDREDRSGLIANGAKYIATAMAYDDVIRVADRKTRAARMDRIEGEMGARTLAITEFFHPGIDEVCGMLPTRLARWIERHPGLHGWLGRRIDRGRRIRSDTIIGFGMLWFVAGLRPWRRGMLRHEVELAHISEWLSLVHEAAEADPRLGAEILACRRLIKGYSDTHRRGTGRFDRVLSALPLLAGREDAADWIRRLRDAALSDHEGTALEGALATVRSFTDHREPEQAL